MRYRLRIQMRVYADASGELLAETMVASTEEAAGVVARVLARHGRQALRVEHALSGGRSVVQHFEPTSITKGTP